MPLEVKTYDIDVAGHMNNIAYVRWLEDLRTELVKKEFDFSRIVSEGYYVVVTSTAVKYKRQVKLFDKPVGRMTLAELRHGILSLEAEISVDGRLCVSAEQKCVVMKLCDSTILKGDELEHFVINRAPDTRPSSPAPFGPSDPDQGNGGQKDDRAD